jgi:hypothetical protein
MFIKKFTKVYPKRSKNNKDYKVRKIFVLLIAVFFFYCNISFGQKGYKCLKSNLSNNDLSFEVAKVGSSTLMNGTTLNLPRNEIIVNSMYINKCLPIKESRKVLGLLISSLKDTTKDFCAALLLYQITHRDASAFLVINSRKEWVTFLKDKDQVYWQEYLLKR